MMEINYFFIRGTLIILITLFSSFSLFGAKTLKWTGCGITKLAFMKEAANEYYNETGIKINLSGGGAQKGIRMANSGRVDIGGNCRPSLPDKFPKKEGDTYITVIAWDALVAIVNNNNPVDNLTSEQLKDILTGKIANWKEVGGPDEDILLILRKNRYSGVGYMLKKIIFNNSEVKLSAKAIMKASSGPAEKLVMKKVNAIAITGISSAKRRSVKILKLDGVAPTVENIAEAKYLLFRPLYLSTRGKPVGEAKVFIDWILSKKGQKIVKNCGTVNLEMGASLMKKYKFWENKKHITNYKTLP